MECLELCLIAIARPHRKSANDLACSSAVSKLDALEKKLICTAKGWAYQCATDETKRIANLLRSALQSLTFLLNSRAEPDTRSVAVANTGDGRNCCVAVINQNPSASIS